MLEIISMFLLVIVVLIVLFWMKKTLFIFGFFFKLFTLAMLVFIVGTVLFGYFVIKDATEFTGNFGNSTSMFILEDNVNGTETFLTGVTINPGSKAFDTMDKTKLKEVEDVYKSGRIDTLNGDYYKIFVVDFKAFADLKIDTIEDNNINLSKEELRQVMLSKNAKKELAEIVAKQTGADRDDVLDKLNFNDEEIKGYIFSYYLTTTFNPSNMGKFLAQLRNDDIQVYKETALFKAVKIIPTFLIDSVVKRTESAVN
jgi:hypothetical protein